MKWDYVLLAIGLITATVVLTMPEPAVYGTDSLYFLKQAENLDQFGSRGQQGLQNTLANYPHMELMSNKPLYPYLLHFFPINNIFFPIFCAILSLTIIFFFTRHHFNMFTAFLSTVTLAVHPRFFAANFLGFLDTNAINMLLSVTTLCAFYQYWQSSDRRWLGALLFTLTLFYFTWSGYLYALAIILLFILLSSDYRLHALGASVGIALLNIPFLITVYQRLFSQKIVDELNRFTAEQLIQAYGGLLLMVFSICAITYVITRYKDKKALFLLSWFSIPFIAGLFAGRFLIYSAPPLAIILAYAAQSTIPRLQQLTKSRLVACAVITLLLTIPAYANITTNGLSPSITPELEEVTEFLQTQPEQPIAAWWDWGYVLQYGADRPTFWAPNSYNSHRGLWLSDLWLTDSSEYAQRLLQTLYCGADIGLTAKRYNLSRESMKDSGIKDDLIEQSFCGTKAHILLHTQDVGEVMNMAQLTGRDLSISRLVPCPKVGNTHVCDNGYRFTNNDVRMNNQHPAAFYNYIYNTTTVFNESKVDFAFVALQRDNRPYGLLISQEYAQSIFVRMLAEDDIKGFAKAYTSKDVTIYAFLSNTTRS